MVQSDQHGLPIAAPTMQHVSCDRCGAPVQPRALSCPFCGAPFVRPAPDGTTPEQIAANLDALLAAGKKLEAIKLYMQLYGTSIADAKQGVEAFWTRRGTAPVASAGAPSTGVQDAQRQPAPAQAHAPVAPASLPNHDGSPPDNRWVLFGDPPPAIGRLLSVSSSMSVEAARFLGAPKPPPVPAAWPKPVLTLVGVVIGLVVSVVLSQVFWGAVLDPMTEDGTFPIDTPTLRWLNLGGWVLPSILFAGLVAYLIGRVLSKKLGKPAAVAGRGETCSYLGAEGLAIARRDDDGVSMRVVTFGQAPYVTLARTHTTFKRPNGTTTTADSNKLGLYDASGSPLLWLDGFLADTPSLRRTCTEYHLAIAAERAFNEFWGQRVLEASETPAGARFNCNAAGTTSVVVSPGRIDVTRSGQTVSLTPGELGRATLKQGTLVLSAPRLGELTLEMAEVRNAKLMLACLSAHGVEVN